MPIDANGIHQYVETESAAPFSNMLNRLAGSVTNVVSGIFTRLALLEERAGRLRLQQVYLNLGATASGTQIAVININRLNVPQRVSVDIMGTLTPSSTTVIGLNATIDAPGAVYINANQTVNAAAGSAVTYSSNRTFDIPAGIPAAITIRFVLSVGAGTGTGNLVLSARTFVQGEY